MTGALATCHDSQILDTNCHKVEVALETIKENAEVVSFKIFITGKLRAFEFTCCPSFPEMTI